MRIRIRHNSFFFAWGSLLDRVIAFVVFMLLWSLCLPAHAQIPGTVSLTATPTSGNGVINVSLSWSSTPAASSCAITGGGATNPTAAASGSVKDTITKTTIYSIACSWTRAANTVTWTPPTTNSDGSALTDLTSYLITWGLVGNSVNTQTKVTNAAATSYMITPPAPGTYNYVIQACNAATLCSTPSASITGPAIGTVSATATATTTVTPIPSTPTGVTVQ